MSLSADMGDGGAVAWRGGPVAWRPPVLQGWLERGVADFLAPGGGPPVDFTAPAGEPALLRPDSVSWRVFRNPVSLFVGGITAVILELGEARVRTGIWEHSAFREQPLRRLQHTGIAAMVTVYGPHSQAEAMIARVRQMHDRVVGRTPAGRRYRANDQELLDWVQATASFGFLEAYHRYVRPLSKTERDRALAEGAVAARLYGATGAPRSEAEMAELFERMRKQLEPSPIISEFLEIIRRAPILPAPLRALQPLLVRAAVEATPAALRRAIELDAGLHGLKRWQEPLVQGMARAAERLLLRSHPAVLACRRLGLPDDYLLRGPLPGIPRLEQRA